MVGSHSSCPLSALSKVLLPVVEPPQLPSVVNFGSLQQPPPAAAAPPPPPPPMPLVPVATQALRPPGQLTGRLVPPAVRAFPHGGLGRSEVMKRGRGLGTWDGEEGPTPSLLMSTVLPLLASSMLWK